MAAARQRGMRGRVVDLLSEDTLRRLQRARHGEPLDLRRRPTQAAPRGTTPATVTEYDAHAVRAEALQTITRLFDASGIAHVVVPAQSGAAREIGVSSANRAVALAALETLRTEPGWAMTPAPSRGRSTVRAERVLATADGTLLRGETAVDIGFWEPVERDGLPRPDGEPHTRGTMLAPSDNGVADYLSADLWHRATGNAQHWPPGAPDVFTVREPIDVVYTWVDGADAEWLRRRAAHQPGGGRNGSAAHGARYLSRDELRYSLRSLSMYASWVNHVYVVTDAQVPAWLRTDHPKLTVVDHRDIFADPDVLPVFNSHAIESQLHHIDGLAEHYLYLNDDTFFGRSVEPELFFHANGIAKFFLGKGTIDLDPPSARDLPVLSAAKNNRALIEREFGVGVARRFKHVAHPQRRSVVAELEEQHPQLFAQVAASRFRHPDDVSIPSSLIHYVAFALGQAVPGEISYRYQDLGSTNTVRRLEGILRERPQMFCLNDVLTGDELPAEHTASLGHFFAACYPLAGPFEKTGA